MNSDNPIVGKDFQERVHVNATEYYKKEFIPEKAVKIGNPLTDHKFDLVSADGEIIIECKCYTWTKTWNVPSAKLATLDEAILYMRCVPYEAKKVIVMSRAYNPKNGYTLAEYFVERKGHLLGDISVVEMDEDGHFRIITE